MGSVVREELAFWALGLAEPRCGCFVQELLFVRMTDKVRGDDGGVL